MSSHLNDMRAVQREIDRSRALLKDFVEPPSVHILRDIEQATKLHQKMLQSTISPLRDELERHRLMMADAQQAVLQREQMMKSIMSPLQAIVDREQSLMASIKSNFVMEEMLRSQRLIEEMKAIPRPNLAFDLQKLLPNHSLWQHIHQQQAAFEAVRLQSALVSQSLRNFAWANEVATRPALMAIIHANDTARLMTRWQEIGRQCAPLAASIACAESQVIAQEIEILEYPEVFEFDDVEVQYGSDDAFLPTNNLYYVQRTELIYVARSNPQFLEDESALDQLGTMQYFNCAQTVCGYVTLINRLCKATGREPVFKLTEQLMQSLVALPTIYAVRQNHFCEYIDHLYFIIYEGAGKDNLRFLNLLSSDESEAVWTLKHLRNYYARHDVEHGSDRDIRKKQERLGAIFVELIGKPQPRTRAEFAAAQLAFLKRIEQMLRLIYENTEREAVRLASHSDGTRDEGKAE